MWVGRGGCRRTRTRRSRLAATTALASATLAVLPAAASYADAGVLDTAYGDGGVAVHAWAKPWTRGFASAAQADGKVVVVGDHSVPAVDGTEWAVVRLTADGQRDADFGTDGFVGTSFSGFGGGGTNRAEAVMVDAEGRILVAGIGRKEGTQHGFLVRYLSTGGLDPDFAQGGVADLGQRFFPTSLASRPDLGVAVAGGMLPEVASPAFVSRVDAFTSTGQPDATFDGDGTALFDLSRDATRDSEPRALLGRADGSLVLAGNAGIDGADGFMLAYVTPDGKLRDAAVHQVGSGGAAFARALAEGPHGTVVAAGYAREASTDADQLALARYDDKASLDPGFGVGGIRLDRLDDSGSSRAFGVAVGEKGQVLAGGGTSGSFVLARYLESGDRDTGFGQGGVVQTAIAGADPSSMALLPGQDAAVLAGSVGDQIGAVRYLGALGSVAGPVLPVASIADVSVPEGTGGTSTARLTVSLSSTPSSPVQLSWATSDWTAVSPEDYATASGTLTIPAGESSGTLSVDLVPDATDEPDESFTVALSSAVGATIGDGTASVTIGDDDDAAPLSVVSVQDAPTVSEGSVLEFPLTLSGPQTVDSTVWLSTTGGTATAGTDYVARTHEEVVIPAGQTTGFFTVTTLDDPLVEPDETLTVEIKGGSNVSLGTPSSATGTIHSTDLPPAAASVGTPAAVEEGEVLRFPITLSRPQNVNSSVRLSTAGGTATAGADYVARTLEEIVIPAGQTTGFFEVTTLDDSLVEPDETLTVEIRGGTNISLGTPSSATGTIHSTDLPPAAASVGTPAAVEEGEALRFPITLSRTQNVNSSVRLSTAGGTATAGTDYVARTLQEIVIPAGQTTGFFEVTTTADTTLEGDETVTVEIRGGTNISLGTPSKTTGTIRDPVTAPSTDRVLTGRVVGTVLYRVPGHPTWVQLTHPTPLPMGTLLDASDGTLLVKYAVPRAKPAGTRSSRLAASRTQTVTLTGGTLELTRRHGIPTLTLAGGAPSGCHGSAIVHRTVVSSSGRTNITAEYARIALRRGKVDVVDRCTTTRVSLRSGVAAAAPRTKRTAWRVLEVGRPILFRR
ncbi:hypothetical protein GON03_18205 [Nocardioides sp. MAH-18]|uniref:Calx-beta domain-containing protein n=1 Tax=Nocardioides agri TaxID=2682843 RepID=A0A6L6XVL4_9ACTN|nr:MULTISPECIES: Calx-beta domain-containing protein [unclassified Nocardioides]MBA2956275.1 hypothetical protein [Nocardioides sp. CGMCC 1.13656]MVQ51118.1 hypothetical protein [Nocardioides sp. MAH-18]